MTRHRTINPGMLPVPKGFSYGSVSAGGKVLHIAGMVGFGVDGIISPDIAQQYEAACQSMVAVIAEAGGEPGDLVSLIVYTTDIDAYRANLRPIGEAHRRVLGRHYPPMALIGIAALFEPESKVELVGTAVVPG